MQLAWAGHMQLDAGAERAARLPHAATLPQAPPSSGTSTAARWCQRSSAARRHTAMLVLVWLAPYQRPRLWALVVPAALAPPWPRLPLSACWLAHHQLRQQQPWKTRAQPRSCQQQLSLRSPQQQCPQQLQCLQPLRQRPRRLLPRQLLPRCLQQQRRLQQQPLPPVQPPSHLHPQPRPLQQWQPAWRRQLPAALRPPLPSPPAQHPHQRQRLYQLRLRRL